MQYDILTVILYGHKQQVTFHYRSANHTFFLTRSAYSVKSLLTGQTTGNWLRGQGGYIYHVQPSNDL